MVLSAKKPSKPRAGCCALKPLDIAARATKTATMRGLVTLFTPYLTYGASLCVAFAGDGDRATFITMARNV